MKKNIISIFLGMGVSCIPLLYSCGDKEVCNFPVQDAAFSFRLVDRDGVNQIAKWGARYLSDSIYVTKSDGTLPFQLGILDDGNIGFFIPNPDISPIDTQVVQQFLLYLPDVQGNSKDDIDTITFKYRLKIKQDVICHDYLQVIFNDSTYHDGPYIDFILFTKK